MRIGVFDIETTDLAADQGRVLIIYLLDAQTERSAVFRGFGPDGVLHDAFEREALRTFWRATRNYDVILSYYGTNFDVPFLKARSVNLRLKNGGLRCRHLDLYYVCRQHLRISRRSLANVGRLLRIREQKERFPFADVRRSGPNLSPRCRRQIAKRCRSDVVLTLRVAQGLRRGIANGDKRTRIGQLKAMFEEMEKTNKDER